ncbi:PKD domain-containing protein [Chryseobacterium sp. MMS23-Vi53]|uniref:PKD domain-containing protein n=1 Tax=Chryseobacterium sp. MMS23-Vi53 TaxID=3386644 RepID=UPI0039E9B803
MNNQLSDILSLSNISTQYRKFSKGQYVEFTQFNEFLDFFEDQDRLSRVMLQGVGIVCGLKPNFVYTNKVLSGIQLSQGAALTTDGDLLTLNNTSEVSEDLYVSDLKTINLENKNYTHFKVYDNFKVNYPAFHENNGKGNQVELWELATAQEATSSFQPISNLSDLDDKYLLLYLENYEKEVRPCRGVDCDNHGVQQIRNLKVLVTTEAGINNIIGDDSVLLPPDPVTGEVPTRIIDRIQPHPLFIEDVLRAEKQERVIVERLILENGVDAHFSSNDIKDLYKTALENNNYGEFVFDKINKIVGVIGGQSVNHAAFKNELQQCLALQTGFQYAYDAVKDLMDTYSEIIKWLPKSFTKAFPDFGSFPKHILLGKLTSNIQLDSFRHQFYNSPVLDDEKATERVKTLISRFFQQTQSFRYSNSFEGQAQIKITPSQKLNPLSNKAVPFYYKITKELLKAWNFDKTSNRSTGENLGYGINFFTPNTQLPDDPLNFNIDKNSFYNIEGHQGMPYQQAVQQIKDIKDKLQLGFDIMVLSLEELKDNKDLSKAYFNDYLEENPGLEHKRGVERGGTFVMVYETIGTDAIVIADFSIPYICCTPKVDTKLSLPSSVVCLKSDIIPFTVFPTNGIVKAVVDEGLDGGVITVNGLYFFDPGAISQQLYGKEITFTVNGKPTNCSIKVILEPNVDIEVSSVHYQESGSTTATVVFTVSGSNFADYDYSWDFLDTGGWVPLNPDENGHVSYTFENLPPTRIPTIKVRVNGGGCSQDIAISDWYVKPEEPTVIKSITFTEGGDCCHQVNRAPVAVARASQTTIQLPVTDIDLTAKFSSDPDNNIDSYSWAQVSPLPSTATIETPLNKETKVSGLVEGVHVFRLKVVDVYGEVDTDDVTITVLRENELVPSLTETSYQMTGTETIQVFRVGPNVSAGNKFWVKVYQVQLTILATSSDTPITIATKLANIINNTTEAQWRQFQSDIASPFPPKASASGAELTIHLDTRNSFVGDALIS